MEKTEITVVEQKVENAVAISTKIRTIKNEAELESAAKFLTDVKKLIKWVTGEKEKITKPLNEALKVERARWAPLEEKAKDAETAVKKAIAAYTVKQEAKQEKKADKIAEDVASGKISDEKGLQKMENLGEVKTNVKTGEGTVAFKTVRKVRFEEVTELHPDTLSTLARGGYLVWDQVKARKDALAGIDVPGATIYEEKEISARV